MPPVAEEMGPGGPSPSSSDTQKTQTKKTKIIKLTASQESFESNQLSDKTGKKGTSSTSFNEQFGASLSAVALELDVNDKTDCEDSISMMGPLRSTKHRDSQPESGTLMQYGTDPNVGAEFFKKEPCLYSHRMFERAAKIFVDLKVAREEKLEKRKRGAGIPHKVLTKADRKGPKAQGVGASQQSIFSSPQVDYKNAKEQKMTYELAFSALKFEQVFEDMLEDCAFFSLYPQFRDHLCLVMVVLFDYQSRKFQPRIQFDADELVENISAIERGILEQKVKLAACLARRRIKEAAPSIDFLLPDKFRNMTNTTKPMPAYAWVNTLKNSPMELLNKLKLEGFTQLWTPPPDIKEFREKSFYLDPHCSDTLVFSMDCNALLQEHPLVEQGYLVRQDKSSCMAANSVVHMLGDEQDVIVFNPGVGVTACHVAALIKERKGSVTVVMEGATPEDHTKLMQRVTLLGATRYIKVINEPLVEVALDDPRIKQVRAALVTAACSKSAIRNIVNYVVIEGENLTMLQDVSDLTDDLDDSIVNLQNAHVLMLRNVLRMHRMIGVTYMTRSVHTQENESVVQRAIEYVNLQQVAKFRQWKVIPPVLPFSGDEVEEQLGISGKVIAMEPTDFSNGCYIVCIAKEIEEPHHKGHKSTKDPGASSSSSGGSIRHKKHRRKSKTLKP